MNFISLFVNLGIRNLLEYYFNRIKVLLKQKTKINNYRSKVVKIQFYVFTLIKKGL